MPSDISVTLKLDVARHVEFGRLCATL